MIVEVAVAKDQRIDTLLGVATRLRAFQQEWPNLYETTMSTLLCKAEYAQAIDCHHRLTENIHPGPAALTGLLSKFILDPAEELQSCLRTIYNFSPWRNLYDRIIPTLYDVGCSRLARDWRGLFLRSGDREASETCRPFLIHLADFYPLIRLTEQEQAVLKNLSPSTRSAEQLQSQEISVAGNFRDEFIAKTFASKWLSLDFAINTIQRLGLTKIGPRALQALALREGSAEEVTVRIEQFRKLGLEISGQTYCKALVFFARNGDQALLQQLVACDIHPDEFDNDDTRRIMAKQPEMKALMQGIEWAVDNQSTQPYLNTLLHNLLGTRHLGKALLVITRMDALKISITQQNMELVLRRIFMWVTVHPPRPKRWERPKTRLKNHDRVIIVLRRLLSHDVGIPIDHWKFVFYILGRLGRFEELLQLALELVRRYKPERSGLVPMHPCDRPTPKTTSNSKDKKSFSELESSEEELEEDALAGIVRDFGSTTRSTGGKNAADEPLEVYWIPSDLPLSHRQHPLCRIFDAKLQRAIVRWGFDQTLLYWPAMHIADTRRLEHYDVALGVRILKVLHDHGVLITKDVVRSALTQRTVMAQLPKRRHRARDSSGVRPAVIKSLVDEAWGPDMLENLEDFEQRVSDARLKAWKRGGHTIQFQHAHRSAEASTASGTSKKHDRALGSTQNPPAARLRLPGGKENDQFWRKHMKESSSSLDYDSTSPSGPRPSSVAQKEAAKEKEEEVLDEDDVNDEFRNRFARKWRGPQW